MPHTFELAASGRSKCRGCGIALAKGELRFGERLPNPFAEGEVTHWFHPRCAAYKRPESFKEGLQVAEPETPDGTAPNLPHGAAPELPDRAALEAIADAGILHARLQRIDGAEKSPGSQAKCRNCKEPIVKGTWRIRLVYHEEGNFAPGGYIHVTCRNAYFEAGGIAEQVLHFSPALEEADRTELRSALEAS